MCPSIDEDAVELQKEREETSKQRRNVCGRALWSLCASVLFFFFLCYFSHRFMITHPQLFWLFYYSVLILSSNMLVTKQDQK